MGLSGNAILLLSIALLCQALVLDPARYDLAIAEAFHPILFILGIVPWKEFDVAITLKCQNVSG